MTTYSDGLHEICMSGTYERVTALLGCVRLCQAMHLEFSQSILTQARVQVTASRKRLAKYAPPRVTQAQSIRNRPVAHKQASTATMLVTAPPQSDFERSWCRRVESSAIDTARLNRLREHPLAQRSAVSSAQKALAVRIPCEAWTCTVTPHRSGRLVDCH